MTTLNESVYLVLYEWLERVEPFYISMLVALGLLGNILAYGAFNMKKFKCISLAYDENNIFDAYFKCSFFLFTLVLVSSERCHFLL